MSSASIKNSHSQKTELHLRLVTIIVPCYNYGWLLAETLDSVLAQTYTHWECLIIDDGSTDDTKAVAESYTKLDKRFHYLYQTNKGLSASRNLGLQHAKGEFLQFLDADDLLLPSKLEAQVNFFATHPEVDIVYGDVRYFNHGNRESLSRSLDMKDQSWLVPLRGHGLPIIELLIQSNRFVVNAPLLRAELLKQVGGFLPELRSLEDWELWVRCAAAGACFYYDDDPAALVFVRVHPASLSQNRPRMLAYMGQVREKIEKSLLEMGAEQALAFNRAELEANREQNAAYNIQHGRLSKGLRLYWELACKTGRYLHYARTGFYLLRRRKAETSN